MKTRRAHIVPLCGRAIEIIRELPVMGDYVFAGRDRGRHLSHPTMLHLLRRLGRAVTVHGMRASFRTWAQEKTSFRPDVVEMCLAHVVGNATEQAYARGDLLEKRRAVMEAWADFLDGPISADVIAIRR
jgi:integrase